MLISRFPDIVEFKEMAETANVIPFYAETLADTETPVSLLKKIYNNNPSTFLFESVEGGERWGRYSFLGVSAKTHIRIFSEFIEIRENNSCKKIPHQKDPLSVLRTLISRDFGGEWWDILPTKWCLSSNRFPTFCRKTSRWHISSYRMNS